jgi:hypothetical protein
MNSYKFHIKLANLWLDLDNFFQRIASKCRAKASIQIDKAKAVTDAKYGKVMR